MLAAPCRRPASWKSSMITSNGSRRWASQVVTTRSGSLAADGAAASWSSTGTSASRSWVQNPSCSLAPVVSVV